MCDKKSNKIDEKKFSKYIMNSEVPNPDLLIRTGSEKDYRIFCYGT